MVSDIEVHIDLNLPSTVPRLTIHTVLKMEDGMTIVDETGRVHNLTMATVKTMLGVGWGAFIAAGLLNIAFYKVQCVVNPSTYIILYPCQVHPSAVDLEVSRFRNKMVINVLGEQKRIMKAAKEEGDYSDYQISLSNSAL